MFGHLKMYIIVNAAQRVGISSAGLYVRKMQQDKFGQAAKNAWIPRAANPHYAHQRRPSSFLSFSTVSPLTPNSSSNTARK